MRKMWCKLNQSVPSLFLANLLILRVRLLYNWKVNKFKKKPWGMIYSLIAKTLLFENYFQKVLLLLPLTEKTTQLIALSDNTADSDLTDNWQETDHK